MLNFLKRAYTPVKFPWSFEKVSQIDLSPAHKSLNLELNELNYAFKQSYITLLHSISQQSLEDIQDFSGKKFSAALKECFSILNIQKYSISLINENCEDVGVSTVLTNIFNSLLERGARLLAKVSVCVCV